MKFDVIRSSDVEAGRIGADAARPCEGALFNKRKNAWVLEVLDLDDLMGCAEAWRCQIRILSVVSTEGLSVLEILDAQ